MKEKEVRLTSEEIDYLLKGTIYWEDISPRVDGHLRKPIDKAPDPIGSSESEENKSSGRIFREYKVDLDGEGNEDIIEEDQPFWSGAKVYFILMVMGGITLGTWAYFVFA